VAAVRADGELDVRVACDLRIAERLPAATNGSSSDVMTSAGTRTRSMMRIELAR